MNENPMNINNNKNQISEDYDDSYDYLDDLMSDMMEEVPEETEKIMSVETQITEHTSNQNYQIQEMNNDKAETPITRNNDVNQGVQKRRAPLLAQFFNEENDDEGKKTSDEQENKAAIQNITEENNDEVIVQKDIAGLIADTNINNKIIKQDSAASESTKQAEIVDKKTEIIEKKVKKENVFKVRKDNKSLPHNSVIKKDWTGSFIEEEDEDEEDIEDEEDDLFESMFADLVDEEAIENDFAKKVTESIDNKLDPEVIVPLEKPGMDKIIVTPDGRSLAEVIPGIRGGRRKSEDVIADIREQKRVVQLENKKFSDNRYLKHVEIAEEKMSEREKRVELSKKFLQKHARFTEQEKIILNNLGLSSDEFAKIIKSTELSIKDKEEIIGLGRYGPEKHFKGKRYRTTLGDIALLEFLVKFKFANTRILRWLSHESQNTTFLKLRRLENNGLIESQSIIGVPDLWGATLTGTGLAGYHLKPGLKPMPKMQTISATMGVNYLAACLWFNTINVLNLEDFPAENKIVGLENGEFKRVRGEELVSELEIRASLGREINPYSSTVQTLGDERLYDVISANVRTEFENWVENGKQGLSPEFIPGNEYMWVLYPTSQLTLSYHVPDLVVRRERGSNGEPRSIAVELERHTKTNDRYDKIMLAYKLDEHLYEKVIWVTPNARSARALDAAAQSVGFENYSIIPIITETGVYNKSDIWLI